MKITYDPEADVLYIQLRDTNLVPGAREVETGVILNYDALGLSAIELLDASARLPGNPLDVTIEHLTGEPVLGR